MSTIIVNGLMIRANGSSRVTVNGWQGGSSLKKSTKQNQVAAPHDLKGGAQAAPITKASVLPADMVPMVPAARYLGWEDIGTMVPTAGCEGWEEKFAFFPVCVGIENGVQRHIRFRKYEVAKFGPWMSYFLLTRECGSDMAYCTHDVDW